jgi:monovalent cation:H+ antiporter-2, CPA2 family
MHLPEQITDLAMILGVAAVVTFICQKLRQPVVLGYLIAGVIVGPYTPTGLTVSDLPNVKVWAELGVIFLMFSLGLEFTFHKLLRVGKVGAGTALVEVVLMVALGYAAGRLMGWASLDCLFLGGILSISSTTIIIKAFDELGVKTKYFAEIVFGVLIVEDLVAILLLVVLTTVGGGEALLNFGLVWTALKLVLIVGSWFLLGYVLTPSFLKYTAKFANRETLTILSVALCLMLVVVATHFEYSAALGAFIMGSILAETSESHRIESLIQPLKDLFGAVFFVSVGMMLDPQAVVTHWKAILFISLFTVLAKSISSCLGALIGGQPLKRAVQIGMSLAQIGEFSFIIATLGITLGVVSDFLFTIAVAVSVITTFLTPYLIRYSEAVSEMLAKVIPESLGRRLGKYAGEAAQLGPWEVHTTRLTLHQNSIVAGQTILDLQVRVKFGLNIVAIQRGARVIVPPAASERLLPMDELLVLGSDDQIDRFRALVETPSGEMGDGVPIADYALRKVQLEEGSEYVGKSIQNAGLRENLSGLVVGLERGASRSVNPDPASILQKDDILWLVTGP